MVNEIHPHQNQKVTNLTSLELFAGAGGLALGSHEAGFRHVSLIEWNKHAIETLRENSRKVLDIDPEVVLHTDAREVDYQNFVGKIDLLTGGPPCQPFSTAGRNKGPNDSRDMFPVLLDAVSVIMPKAIIIENVRGLLRAKFKDYFDYIILRLRFPLLTLNPYEKWSDHLLRLRRTTENEFLDNEQYVVNHQVIDTADFGIPQRRIRVIFTAFRRDLNIPPFELQPTHSRAALLSQQWITNEYWERHNIAPYNYLGSTDMKLVQRLRKTGLTNGALPWVTVRDAIGDLPEPVARGEQELILNHVQHPGARIYKGHIGSYWDYPAKALKAGTHGTPGGENILRVNSDGSEVRYFTTREAGRLHTFPDEWHFLGTWGACIKQLGNAVPVKIARLFSSEINRRIADTIQS